MTEYTRLTIVGSTRRAEMVVPGDEAIGALIPQLMELLDEKPGAVSRPLTLVRATGEQLDTTLSVSDQSVFDGETLRLLREDAAPPPPEVSDVTDAVAENHDDRPDRWNASTRRAVAAAGIGSAGAAGGVLAQTLLTADLFLAAGWGIALVAAVIAGRAGGRWLAVCFTAVAAGLSLPLAPALGAALPALEPLGLAAPVLLAATLVWISLALGVGAAFADRAAWWGGVIGTLVSAAVPTLVLVGVDPLGAVGTGGVLAVLVCGLLPWYAMSASGLTGLDDQVVEGRLRRRDTVLVTVDTAYRALTWATFAVAGPLAVSAATLLASSDGWAVGLGAAIVVVVASRTRAMPLALQATALWAAAAVGAVLGALTQVLFSPVAGLAVLAAGAVVAAIAGAVAPPEHRRASLRRIGNLLEALAVASLLPVLVGLFGVYSDLLAAF